MDFDVSKLQGLVDHITGQIAGSIGKYGPPAWKLLCQMKQAESIGYIIIGFICLIIMVVAIKTMIPKGRIEDAFPYHYGPSVDGVICIFGYVITIVSGATATIILLNMWNWIGIFAPQFVIIHELLTSITQSK